MFKNLGIFVIKYRVFIVVFWVVAAVAMFFFAPSVSQTGKMDQSSFLPQNSESRKASDLIGKYFPRTGAGSSGTLVVFNPSGLTDIDYSYSRQLQGWLLDTENGAGVVSVTSIFTNPELISRLVSPDQTTMLLNLGMKTSSYDSRSVESVTAIREYVKNAPDGLKVYFTGSAGIYGDMSESLHKSIDLTTLITVLLVIVLLLVIYRSPVASLVPLFTIGLAYLVARGVLGLLAQAGVSIWSNIDVFLIVLVFGAGTDYCLFMVSRFREELRKEPTRELATRSTVTRISAVITASGFAVIIGLSGMYVAHYQMIKTMGPVLGLAILITLLAALTLTPSLASLFGTKLFWPAHGHVRKDNNNRGFWYRLAGFTTGYPWVVIPLVIIFMAVPLLALPGLVRSYDQMAELPKGTDSTEGYRILKERFNVGEMDPVTTIVVTPEGDNITGPAGLALLVKLGNDIRAIDGIAQVQTIVQPYGTDVIPVQLTASGQLATLVSGLSGGGGSSSSSANMSAVAQGVRMIGAYLAELKQGFPWVGIDTDYNSTTVAVQKILVQLQALQSGTLLPADQAQAAGIIQQQLTVLGQHGTALAAKFQSQGNPAFLPASFTSDPQLAAMLNTFVSQDSRASCFYVVLDSAPQSNEALNLVKEIRAAIKSSIAGYSGYDVAVGGSTASLSDVRTILDSDFTRVQIVVLCGIFLVFVILLRSLVAPVYLLCTVLLSYGTTLGLVTWIFQDLLGQDGVSFIVPIVVFVLLVAIGADYNIFLMSRVHEESETQPARLATRVAATATGSVITACGIILAGTFAALLVSPLRIMVQVGTAVALGVLIDTFVVRSLLVPAIATLVGRRNWWPSRFGNQNHKGPA